MDETRGVNGYFGSREVAKAGAEWCRECGGGRVVVVEAGEWVFGFQVVGGGWRNVVLVGSGWGVAGAVFVR